MDDLKDLLIRTRPAVKAYITRNEQNLLHRDYPAHYKQALEQETQQMHDVLLRIEEIEADRQCRAVLWPHQSRANPAAQLGGEQSKGFDMHYRNGREAANGDKIVRLEGGVIVAFGTLQDATPGNDYCNGNIVHEGGHSTYACMCDCLHVDDVAEMLAEKGLDKRPEGK